MSNNSNLSLTAKNISQYATIGSAFLGGLVGFFIGKSMGPSEPEVEETVSSSESVPEPVSSEPVSSSESVPEPVSSEPIALSSSSIPQGQTMGFVPVSTTAEEVQNAVLQEEPKVEVEVEKEQVFPSLAPVEAAPMASLEPTINPNVNPNPTNTPSGIQGGKMRSSRRKPRKPRQRASRKYGGQAFGTIVPPTSA